MIQKYARHATGPAWRSMRTSHSGSSVDWTSSGLRMRCQTTRSYFKCQRTPPRIRPSLSKMSSEGTPGKDKDLCHTLGPTGGTPGEDEHRVAGDHRIDPLPAATLNGMFRQRAISLGASCLKSPLTVVACSPLTRRILQTKGMFIYVPRSISTASTLVSSNQRVFSLVW